MRRTFTLWVVGLLVLASGLVASASNHTLDDYRYVLSVGMHNQTGSALTASPVAITMQPLNLVNQAIIQADAEDWRPVTSAGVALEGVAQGMAANNQTWWIDIPSQGPGSTAQYDFHTYNTTATRDQRFRFNGSDGGITIADHAELDFTNLLSVELDVELLAIPAADTYLLNKHGAYGIGVRDGTTVFAQVHTGNATIGLSDQTSNGSDCFLRGVSTLHAAGAVGEAANLNGVNGHLKCTSDATLDNIFSGGGTLEFYLNLDTVTAADFIARKDFGGKGWRVSEDVAACGANTAKVVLDVTWDGGDGKWTSTSCILDTTAGWQHISITYDSDSTGNNALMYLDGVSAAVTAAGTQTGTVYSDEINILHIGNLFRPLDGQVDEFRVWNDTRTAAELLANYNVELGGTEAGLAAYWRLDSLGTEVSYASIVVDTEYTFRVTYDGATITLYVDDVSQDTAADAGSATDTAQAIVIGDGINGYFDDVHVGILIPAPALLLRSDTGVTATGGLVDTWADQSGNGNNFTGTGGKRPTETASVFGVNPGITFDGSTNLLDADTGAFLTGSSGLILGLVNMSSVPAYTTSFLASSDEATTSYFIFTSPTRSSGSPKMEITQTSGGGNDELEGTTSIVSATDYVMAWGSDGSAYTVWLDGVDESAAVITGADTGDWFADTANRDNVTLGAMVRTSDAAKWPGDMGAVVVFDDVFDTSIVTAVTTWLTAYAAGTETAFPTADAYLTLDFEPDELAETQQGNSGNSWAWAGTVEDVSTVGVDHDGTYALTRNMIDLTRWTYNLRNKLLTVTWVGESKSDLLGLGVSDPTSTTGETPFLFRDYFEAVLEHPNIGVTPLAAWYVFLTTVGLLLTFGMWAATKTQFLTALALPAVYWVAWALGIPLTLWVPLIMSLVALGFLVGVKRVVQA